MTDKLKPTSAQPQSDNSLAIISLVLGIVSLAGPGLLLGIPAIITGSIALKQKRGERGLSITGIITGAFSTLISLLFILFIVFLLAIGVMTMDSMYYGPYEAWPLESPQPTESLPA